MIKNENLHEKKFISLKREKPKNSSLLISGKIFKGKNINRANKKFHSKKINYKKFGKYNNLIENFYINTYGLIRIKERCASCGVQDFLTNELFYFKNMITLFFYLKYIFHVTKNKLFLDNKIYIENYNEIKRCKKIDFNLKTKFLFPKTICKKCFVNLINKQNLIQNLTNMLEGDDISSSIEFNNINNINPNNFNLIETKNKKDKFEDNMLYNNITLKNKELKEKKYYQLKDQNIININENINNINNYNINGNNIIFNEININDYNYLKNKIKTQMNKINNYNIINDINFDKNNIINQENLYSQNNDEFKYIFNSIINKKIDNNNISVDDNEKDKQIINYDSKNFFNDSNPIITKEKEDNTTLNFINNSDNKTINNQKNIPNQQLNIENNINLNINANKINSININKTRQLFSNQHTEFQNCLIELKSKILDIINLFNQIKSQYYFLINNYPNLSDIIISYKKSFFLLHYVAESEIINNLVIFQHYINQRIMIIITILNYLGDKVSLSDSQVEEIKKLKLEVKELYLSAEKNNNIFIESMNKFLEVLKSFWILFEPNKNA
jgi:hypothetical protein